LQIVYQFYPYNNNNNNNRFTAPWTLSRTTQVSQYQKGKNQEGKTNLDLLEQEIVKAIGSLSVCSFDFE